MHALIMDPNREFVELLFPMNSEKGMILQTYPFHSGLRRLKLAFSSSPIGASGVWDLVKGMS